MTARQEQKLERNIHEKCKFIRNLDLSGNFPSGLCRTKFILGQRSQRSKVVMTRFSFHHPMIEEDPYPETSLPTWSYITCFKWNEHSWLQAVKWDAVIGRWSPRSAPQKNYLGGYTVCLGCSQLPKFSCKMRRILQINHSDFRQQ